MAWPTPLFYLLLSMIDNHKPYKVSNQSEFISFSYCPFFLFKLFVSREANSLLFLSASDEVEKRTDLKPIARFFHLWKMRLDFQVYPPQTPIGVF
jgi:hypothetical protein